MRQHLLKSWFPLAVAGTILALAGYASAQQMARQSANDPQIQLAEDGAAALESGYAPAALIGSARIDMGKSLAPFVTIYGEDGTVIGSTGYLNGSVPVIPKGVLEYAKAHGDDRLTWQPASTTRIAAVVMPFAGKSPGYIVAGRSLREVESRESFLGLVFASAWVCLIVITLVISIYSYVAERKEEELAAL